MKSYYYVDLSMNDDCVQYSILYPSNDELKTNTIKNAMKHIASIYFQSVILGTIENIEIRIDSNNIDCMIVISMMKYHVPIDGNYYNDIDR